MNRIDDLLQHYLQSHTDQESDLLKFIDRDTHLHVLLPRMLSGHYQGRVLSMLSKLKAPKTILEIGTYTGYSALCLAEGLSADGQLISIDVNEELEQKILNHWRQSPYASQMQLIIGQASVVIPDLKNEFFDLVFIDADKKNYKLYYDLVIDRVPSGGLILADNVLWSGKVLDDTHADKDTVLMKAFNDAIAQDDRVEKVILPIRDGVFMIRKK
jgi:caffeoyl-CoA O-methyltransferase